MQNNLFKSTKNELIEEILKLRKELDKSKDKIQDLEWKLNLNSLNSSKPSSTNLLSKKTQICNSRIKWNKPRWWQIGHKWNTLKQSLNPDIITNIEIHTCENCKANLDKIKPNNEIKRQVLDIPKPIYIITEYVCWEKTCPWCNHLNKAVFPKWVIDSVQYWSNIKASSVYMYNYIFSSYERLEKYWKEIYNLDISQTTLLNYNKKWFKKLDIFEKSLKTALMSSSTINSDETWTRVNSKTNWIHNASTQSLTFYWVHEKRWKEAINEMEILPNYRWNLISDHWKSYTFYKLLFHYFCNAHHLRELEWVSQNEKKKWSKKMKRLLLKAKQLKDEALKRWEFNLSEKVLEEIHKEYKRNTSRMKSWIQNKNTKNLTKMKIEKR